MSNRRRRRACTSRLEHDSQLRAALGAAPDVPWLDLLSSVHQLVTSVVDARPQGGCNSAGNDGDGLCLFSSWTGDGEYSCKLGGEFDGQGGPGKGCPLLSSPVVVYLDRKQ